jgi:hypothetical protein
MDIRHRYLHANHRLYPVAALTAGLRALLALIALHVAGLPALAQSPVSVEVSPLRVELKLTPGGTHTQAITISNTGKEAIRIRASVRDWHLSRDGAPQFREPEDGRAYSASTWIRIAPPELVIQPNMEGTVRFSLTVPAGVDPAGYRSGIMFELGAATGDPITRRREVAVRSQIATLIYANVGEPKAAVDLIDLRSRVTAEQTIILATLKSTGRRTVRTKGSVTVYGAGNAVVRQVSVPDAPVLPESERDLAITIADSTQKALPPGEYRIEVKIDVGLPALIIGETTLKVGK